ncbi:hypothetical protein AMATHDRAFT_42011 [Amanita thiersii Skay4041]|uniref:Protein kinase domain-containing protein n=1 Tax=Amanita thiersii Skay4041 TaxID=703135 RepID=A0A2A9NM10_9AGAR|nr:hypothetical protein AMATHDRAFT_42011 [Amanita thiersii Skay4041]
MPQTRSQTTSRLEKEPEPEPIELDWLFLDRSLKPRVIDIELPFHAFFNRPKQRISLDDVAEEGWSKTFTDVEEIATEIPLTHELSRSLGQSMEKDSVHLIITGHRAAESAQVEASDMLTGLPDIIRYVNALKYAKPSLAAGAKSTEYIKIQRSDAKAIYDGRYALGGHATAAPPIQIFHPVFEAFIRRLTSNAVALGRNNLSEPDGMIKFEVEGTHVPILIIEIKKELGDGGSDPTTQVGLSSRANWIENEFSDRLTDMLWVGHGSAHPEIGVEQLAHVFQALHDSLLDLARYYQSLILGTDGIKPFNAMGRDVPHPRFFPYPTSFTSETQTVEFDYVRRMENDAGCVTFLAKTRESEPRDIVVKFVLTYGNDVHKLLAAKGFAPDILYHGGIPEAGTILSHIPFPENAIEWRRLLPQMKMVVMDYVKESTPPVNLDNARTQLDAALRLLHEAGYAFGDLRQPNVLFDCNEKLKLIDFDWAGQYNQADQVADDPFDTRYAHYPPALSTTIEWAKGAKSFGCILPQHDREMMETLLKQLYESPQV